MLVGIIFAIWFMISMVTAVLCVPERQPTENRPKAPPIVPSMRSALNNRLFLMLLPAWLLDNYCNAIIMGLLPYFVEVVVAPAWATMEEHGRDCAPKGAWKGEQKDEAMCSNDMVIVFACYAFLVTALLALPIWNLLVVKMGKVRTWLLWSLTTAASNLLLLFVGKGDVYFFLIAVAVNGAPMGAKFLSESILADIIDYDEFLTGMRSEATYFMFKGFLPKIVQIPATAIPVALLTRFAYNPPVGGRVQDQDSECATYIRVVGSTGAIAQLIAYAIKTRYPLKPEAVKKLEYALKDLRDGKYAKDPISERPYRPMTIESEGEQEAFWLFNHYDIETLHIAFQDQQVDDEGTEEEKCVKRFTAGCAFLARRMKKELFGTIVFFIIASIGTAATIGNGMLDDPEWSFLPTLFGVAAGMGISATGFAALRLKASRQLDKLACECNNHNKVPPSDAIGATETTDSKRKSIGGKLFQDRVKRLLDHQKKIGELHSVNASRRTDMIPADVQKDIDKRSEPQPTASTSIPVSVPSAGSNGGGSSKEAWTTKPEEPAPPAEDPQNRSQSPDEEATPIDK